MKKATFFTRDGDFFRYRLCHSNHCLVMIDLPRAETGQAILRFLRHPQFKTKAQRCGKVLKLSPRKITWWEINDKNQQYLIW